MATITKGKTFTSGEVVTPAKLNGLVDDGTVTFTTVADTDDSTIEVSGNKFRVKDGGITSAKLLAAVANALTPVGAVQTFARSTAPTGWLAANGDTIGSASSNATNASADYSALFAVLWDNWSNTDLPILTSGGSASTRGASAAADFAANKRLPLPDLRGIFVRGSGSQTISGTAYSGTFAAKQQDELKAHTHELGSRVNATAFGIGIVAASNSATINGNNNPTASTGGTETRPANIALLYCIKF